ncbi:hypothetical protein QTI99_08270 [Clostridium perfringens]|uniref:hypothetical protein n=1 Tax=Clostridium perfringens TaxID=1502 RepID=UPI0013DE5F91|nr:hypothetical protein [Clostridium perfringens]EJT6171157.1 hypothetical protein [Clostridium perfringens]EJT6541883.1 hypothetical protein [Clostridium perfringens]EJT6566890.1 hypothetical protein [Clostridium perfringens]MBS5994376.1 hypothetical protein [Clostridium perfringens]MDM0997460.1 hypothetical protein [Clostridium perfringens]
MAKVYRLIGDETPSATKNMDENSQAKFEGLGLDSNEGRVYYSIDEDEKEESLRMST